MSVLNSYLEKIAKNEQEAAETAETLYEKAKRHAGTARDYIGEKSGKAYEYAKANPYKTGGGALALAGGLYGAKKLKDHYSEKKAAYEQGYYDAIEKIAKDNEQEAAETAETLYEKAKRHAGTARKYVGDKASAGYELAKAHPYKTGAGALALAGGLYGAKKLKDHYSEKKAAYEQGYYDAIEKIASGVDEAAKEATEATPGMYEKMKGHFGKAREYVGDKAGKAYEYAKANPYKTGGGALALAGGLYGAKKLKDHYSEKKAEYQGATLDKVAMWRNAGY